MGMNQKQTQKFVNILGSEGDFRMVVTPETEGAVKRTYEKDGNTLVKHELVFRSIEGTITNIEVRENEYGKNVLMTMEFDDDTESVVVSVNSATNYGEDLLQKIPALDLKKPVEITPYNLTDEGGKERRGVSIKQDEEKIKSFFSEYDEENKKWINKNGIPLPEGDVDSYEKDDWKMYYMKRRKFLVEYLENQVIVFMDTKPEAVEQTEEVADVAKDAEEDEAY